MSQVTGNRKTIADRLTQYGPAARARLKPLFDKTGVNYPPQELTLVGLKQEEVLELYARQENQKWSFVHRYRILAASGDLGPKLREGDQQVPEGIYAIESLNPNSRFHLSLRINYPNAFDRQQAAKEKRSHLGGDIMIHGSSVSIGCLAMGDEAAEDLFVLAADTGLKNIKVILSPLDFREGKQVPAQPQLPAWTPALYQTVRTHLQELPKPPARK